MDSVFEPSSSTIGLRFAIGRRRQRAEFDEVELPARISAITLACRDIGRMAAFYRQFSWPEAPTSAPEHVVFQCANGVVLGLLGETIYERQFGRVADGFRGVAVTIHCESPDEVDALHALVATYDDLSEIDPETSRSGVGSRLQLPRSREQRLGRGVEGRRDIRRTGRLPLPVVRAARCSPTALARIGRDMSSPITPIRSPLHAQLRWVNVGTARWSWP